MKKEPEVIEMSVQELEALLKRRKEAESKALERAKKAYEADRDKAVREAIHDAKKVNALLSSFKQKMHEMMEMHGKKLSEYGEIRSNSKGGFSLQSSDGMMRIRRRRDTEPQWDERSQKAIELIRDFLGDTIKKRDSNLFEILMSFLQRNIKGELEYSRVMDLLTHEDKYDDPRWKEGLRLIKESFSSNFKGYGYEFQVKCEKSGKWEAVSLNFSSL